MAPQPYRRKQRPRLLIEINNDVGEDTPLGWSTSLSMSSISADLASR